MIPAIATIIAAYAIARLLQVPLERSTSPNREWFLWTISLLGMTVIAWFTFIIWTNQSEASDLFRRLTSLSR